MVRVLRCASLVVALIAFGLQVGTAASVRCQMMMAAGAGPTHHHSAPGDQSGGHPQHATHCICLAGCQVGLTHVTAATTDGPAHPLEIRPAGTHAVAPIALAARDHLLPPAQAPPVLR